MSLKMFWKISISTIQNALRQSLGGGLWGEGSRRWEAEREKIQFFKKRRKAKGLGKGGNFL